MRSDATPPPRVAPVDLSRNSAALGRMVSAGYSDSEIATRLGGTQAGVHAGDIANYREQFSVRSD